MKRVFVYLAALVGVGSAVYLAGTIQAQQPGAAPAAPKASGKVAVFNVAKVMKGFQRWQHFAGVMNDKRTVAAGELGKLKNEIADLQAKIQSEPIKQKQEEMAKVMVAKQREFEDKERTVRTALDNESAGFLRELFQQIQACVKAVVDANGFDVVFSYPDAITAEEMTSPLYYDLKLRPQAAMPFYVSPPADMTDVLVQTLNANFKAPVAAAGATTPPAPGGQPGKQ